MLELKESAIVVLNGFEKQDEEVLKSFISPQIDLFAADGGANLLYRLKLLPVAVYGDLDSIEPKGLLWLQEEKVEIKKFSPIKDASDGEIIFEALEKEYQRIYVVGALGKRWDHSLVNLFLLERFPKLIFITAQEQIQLAQSGDTVFFNEMVQKRVSVLPLTQEAVLSFEGFLYGKHHLRLERFRSQGLSNEVVTLAASIMVEAGKIIIIQERGNIDF